MDLAAWYMFPIIIVAGILAGVINTLAGNGSVVTLSLLLFLGLDANVANGTNRIGAIFQTGTALATFKNAVQMKTETSKNKSCLFTYTLTTHVHNFCRKII